MIHIVLFEPEIPQNTGNIMRTCVAMHAELHLIKPLGFMLDEKHLRRAGLDYMKDLKYTLYENWDDFESKHPSTHKYCVSRYAQKTPDIMAYPSSVDIYFVFGKESTGIPRYVLQKYQTTAIRIPMVASARSMNLSNCVAIVLYEANRQLDYQGLVTYETIKGKDFIFKV